MIYNTLIIGSGPAAYTAGIYAARANLQPIIFEGNMPGGQLITTSIIENYPGFSDGIDGYELMQEMRKQSINSGCVLIDHQVQKVNLQVKPFQVYAGDKIYETNSLIIATGATAKKLNLLNGNKYWTKGISACATCDGPLPIFKNKPIAVVGGGDTACEEALYLSKFGSIIYLIVRSDKMRASKIMQSKVLKNNKIKIIYETEVIDVDGDNLLKTLKIINNKTNEIETINVNGLFFAIGHVPNTIFLNNQIELDEKGYIKTNNCVTNIPGCFAAGDVQDSIYRQAITAAASGCMAALECEKYLEHNNLLE